MNHRRGIAVGVVALALGMGPVGGAPPAHAASAGAFTFTGSGHVTPPLGALPGFHQLSLSGSGTAWGSAGGVQIPVPFTCTATGSSPTENLVLALDGALSFTCAGGGAQFVFWASTGTVRYTRLLTTMTITGPTGASAQCQFVPDLSGGSFTIACEGGSASPLTRLTDQLRVSS